MPQEKFSRAERSWTNPLNALQEAIHYCFIKFCIYCFSLWHKFFVHCALRFEKNYQNGLDVGPLEFQFLRLMGCLTNPFRTLSLCLGVIGKNTRSLWYEFFVHYALRVEINYQNGLDVGPLEFQFLQLTGCLANPFSTLSLCFRVIGKNTRSRLP